MTWWVYENIYGRVRVHDGACSFCDDGRGLNGEGSTPTGDWHGPYEDLRAAWAFAYGLDRSDTDACGHCRPYPPVARIPVRRLLSGGYRLMRVGWRIQRLTEYEWVQRVIEEIPKWQSQLPFK